MRQVQSLATALLRSAALRANPTAWFGRGEPEQFIHPLAGVMWVNLELVKIFASHPTTTRWAPG